jgi:hypothetical protein
MDHAAFDSSRLPAGMAASLRRLREKLAAALNAQGEAKPVAVVNRHMLDTLGKDRWIPAMLPTDERADTDLLLYATPQPQPQASAEDIEEIEYVRKSGWTDAAEAAWQRIRASLEVVK